MSVREATERAVRGLQALRNFCEKQNPAEVFVLRYEEMVTRPEETGRQLCDFLEVPYAPEMLEYYRFRHHVFGGNLGPTLEARVYHGIQERDDLLDIMEIEPDYFDQEYFEDQKAGSKLDLRWKDELTQEMLHEIDNIGGRLNRELGYTG